MNFVISGVRLSWHPGDFDGQWRGGRNAGGVVPARPGHAPRLHHLQARAVWRLQCHALHTGTDRRSISDRNSVFTIQVHGILVGHIEAACVNNINALVLNSLWML